MKKFWPILFIPALLFAEGPKFTHEDPALKMEIENIYQDLRHGVTVDGSDKCIDDPTFCVDTDDGSVTIASATIDNITTTDDIDVRPGTSDDTSYTTLSLYGGGNNSFASFRRYTTTGVQTSTKTIYAPSGHGGLILIAGDDGTNYFNDLVMCAYGSTSVDVVKSHTVQASPEARTYSIVSNKLKLKMAAGTYSVTVLAIDISER